MSRHDRLPPVCPAPAYLMYCSTFRRHTSDLSASWRSVSVICSTGVSPVSEQFGTGETPVLLMNMHRPAKILPACFREHVGHMRRIYGDVMLEALLAYISQQ